MATRTKWLVRESSFSARTIRDATPSQILLSYGGEPCLGSMTYSSTFVRAVPVRKVLHPMRSSQRSPSYAHEGSSMWSLCCRIADRCRSYGPGVGGGGGGGLSPRTTSVAVACARRTRTKWEFGPEGNTFIQHCRMAHDRSRGSSPLCPCFSSSPLHTSIDGRPFRANCDHPCAVRQCWRIFLSSRQI